MRSTILTIALLAALLPSQGLPTTAQKLTSLKCPPAATLSGEEGALRAATEKYLNALKAKDWDAITGLSVSSLRAAVYKVDKPILTDFDRTQSLMRDLLNPLEIEALSFEIHEVSGKPCEASVRYTLSLRAVDPQTRQPSIAVTDLGRTALWQRFECECPAGKATEWKIGRDATDAEDMAKALAAAKTADERALLRLGHDDWELRKLAAAWILKGRESLAAERAAEAFDLFRLSQSVIGETKQDDGIEKLARLEGELAEARKANDDRAEAVALYEIGKHHLELGQYERALKSFEGSLGTLGETGTGAWVYHSIGKVYGKQGDYARATGYYLKSLEIFKTLAGLGVGINDAEFMGAFFELLRDLAFAYEEQGRDDLAAKSVHEVLKWIPERGQVAAVFLLAVGIFHKEIGNTTQAVRYLEQCATVAKEIDTIDEPELEYRQALLVGRASLLLIELYLDQGDYTNAARHLVQVRYGWKDEASEEGDEEKGASLFYGMYEGAFYSAQGDESVGKFYGKQFISILKDLAAEGMKEGTVDLDIGAYLLFAGLEQLSQGNAEAAREQYALLLKLAAAAGDERLIAQAHLYTAMVDVNEKDYRPALESLNRSLQILERLKPSAEAPLTELQAETAAARALLGTAYAALGEYEQALNSYLKVLERRSGVLYKQDGIEFLHLAAAMYFMQGRYDKALHTVGEELSLIRRTGKRENLWAAHALAGMIHRASKRYKLAAGSFKTAIRQVEASRYDIIGGERVAQRFFEDKLSPYHEMIATLVEQNRCEEALRYAEQSKSRVLLDVLKRGRNDISENITSVEREHERELRAILIDAERQFDRAQAKDPDSALTEQLKEKRGKARLDFDGYRARLFLKYHKQGKSRQPPPGIVGPARFADLLPSTYSALLEFVVTEDKTYLFTLTRENSPGGRRRTPPPPARCEVHIINVKAEEMAQPVNDFTLRVAHPDGVVKPLARSLYNLLLKPAQDTLAGKTNLVIVPDRILWTLPFQALQPNDGRYLLQDSAISYAPSLTSLREMRVSQARRTAKTARAAEAPAATQGPPVGDKPTLLVMANPAPLGDASGQAEGVNTANNLPPLLKTEAQARDLARLYGPGRSKVYTGRDAEEARFKKEAQSFDVIHIGAHGLFDDDDPMHSRVLLAGAEQIAPSDTPPSAISPDAIHTAEDGLLEAWEIIDLKLKANLVVISACETARGRVGDGEGIIGLTWALFMAGVPSTVVSQWEVDEDATTELMHFFHENLAGRGAASPPHPRKAEALRHASLKLIGSERYKHPYYWAGFILVGDGN